MREEPPPRAVFPPVMPEPFHPASGAFANEKRRDPAIENRAVDGEWRTDVFPAPGEPFLIGRVLTPSSGLLKNPSSRVGALARRIEGRTQSLPIQSGLTLRYKHSFLSRV